MFSKYDGVSRIRAAELLCCDVLTPSVELKAKSAQLHRARGGKLLHGAASAEAAIRAQQLLYGAIVRDWMLANPGQSPDLEALLPE